MKRIRPTLTYAVQWIAHEDDPGNDLPPEDLAGTISVALVADLFGKQTIDIANRVYAIRHPEIDSSIR